ncbi:MAG TPA: TldD/PmbA family protein [Turneriella sp.]|nr:TldD/PmbA family protein [Turneriella sp.]
MQREITRSFIEKEIRPLSQRYAFARALLIETSGLTVSSNLNQTFVEPLSAQRGIVVSILHNGLLYEGSSVVHSARDVSRTIAELEDTVRQSRHQGTVKLIPEEPMEFTAGNPPADDLTENDKATFATRMAREIKARNPLVAMASARYKQVNTREIYVSGSKSLEQYLPRFEAIYSAVLKDNATQSTAQIYDGFSRQGSWHLMADNLELIDGMLHDGQRILGAPRLTPGYYDCVFSPSLSGMLAHEAFGHGTEADTMQKGRARGTEYLGKMVASDKVRLYDSPQLEGAAASYHFDHEGMPAAQTQIVEQGVLTQPMTDHASASRMGYRRSPNGRRESFDHKIYSRMTNTYFMPGNDDLQSMIASITDGYFVDRATNGMEDPKSWGIQLEALVARRIRNGRLTDEYFSPVIVTGYVPEILQSISMVSGDLHINGLGMCGKGYKEWVKVTDGGPYLKLRARLA